MHVIKGGWVGQTFALAKVNDSGGRKSRIRRSKEERKAMVKSFIKKYQNSNNGSFPSLNLTHKEVGGSFYTVREIVREIIQENRVLGPAKLTPEEQNADSFFEQYPLGSITMDPQVHVVSSNVSHVRTTPISYNRQHSTSEAKVLESNAQCPEPQQWGLDNEKTVNVSIQESGESLHKESTAMKCLEGEENVEKELATYAVKIPKIIDFMVEAFPSRPVTDTIISLDGDSGRPSVFAGTLKEKEIINKELEAVNNCPVLEISSSLVHEKSDIQTKRPMSERGCVNNKAEPSLESLYHSTTKNSNVLEVNDDTTDLEIKDVLPAETKPMSPPDGTENFNGTISSSSECQSISEEVAINEEFDIRHGGSSQKVRHPTLDRINLESWEATTDRPTSQNNNSLLAFIKDFITAFVKFWSE